jgi:hypothetical protein
MQALMLGATLLLIPNALFALWLTWLDLRDDGTLTQRGQGYVTSVFSLIAVTLILALMGVVGYIQTI